MRERWPSQEEKEQELESLYNLTSHHLYGSICDNEKTKMRVQGEFELFKHDTEKRFFSTSTPNFSSTNWCGTQKNAFSIFMLVCCTSSDFHSYYHTISRQGEFVRVGLNMLDCYENDVKVMFRLRTLLCVIVSFLEMF